MSDRLVKLRVHVVVGVEQIKLHTTNVSHPYRSVNLIVGVRNINNQRISVLVVNTLYGDRVEVLSLVLGNLLSVHAQSLGEVTETIEETNGTHVNVAVRSLLHIVTGKHTETTRINLQCRMDTILHAEVCYRRTRSVGLNIHVLTERLVNTLNALHQSLILHNLLLTIKAQALKQQHGVVLNGTVELWIEISKQITCLEIPYPPKVVGNLVKTLKLLGEC